MGLDVLVFQNIKKLPKDVEDYDFVASNYKEFKERCQNLEWGEKYNGETKKRMISYPYSFHNEFRRELAVLIGKERRFWESPDVSKDVPFYELFDFADNEGTIDWESSKNLYTDFVEYKQLATEKLPKEYLEYYNMWLETFELGKDAGVVVFT
jgi:hypothetical protein